MTHDGYTNRYSFVLNKRPITLVPLTPRQVYEDQVRLKKERDVKKESESSNEREKREKEAEIAKKKKRKSDKECKHVSSDKESKHVSFYARGSEIKKALHLNQPMIVLLYKEACFSANEINSSLPSVVVYLFQFTPHHPSILPY